MADRTFWGQSLYLDLHGCDKDKFTRNNLQKFCKGLCDEIEMEQCGKAMVKRFGEGKLRGNSALQFIKTSSITIHTDEFFNRVFIDIFSCKRFNRYKAKAFCKRFFSSKKIRSKGFFRFWFFSKIYFPFYKKISFSVNKPYIIHEKNLYIRLDAGLIKWFMKEGYLSMTNL